MSEEQAPYRLNMTEQLRRARNFDEMADKIEPFAQSLALLADDMREASSQTIEVHKEASESLSENINNQWQSMADDIYRLQKATKDIEQLAIKSINQAVAKIPTASTNWWLILACTVSGLVLGMGASWHLLKPSKDDIAHQNWGIRINHEWSKATPEKKAIINEIMGWRNEEE